MYIKKGLSKAVLFPCPSVTTFAQSVLALMQSIILVSLQNREEQKGKHARSEPMSSELVCCGSLFRRKGKVQTNDAESPNNDAGNESDATEIDTEKLSSTNWLLKKGDVIGLCLHVLLSICLVVILFTALAH